jgi:hypothetical protein
MPLQTFNPISGPFERLPTNRPGTVIISLHNGKANQTASAKLSPPRVITGIAIILFFLSVSILVFGSGKLGIGGIVVSVLLAGVGVLLTHESPLSLFFIGANPTFYLVDVSPHTITDERRVQLADTGIYANVEIEYRATVIDPVGIVQRGISDVREYLSRRFYSKIALMAAEGTLNDKIGSLRKKLSAMEAPGDELISVEEATFEVAVEGAAADHLAQISASSLYEQGMKARLAINALERGYYEMIISDDNALIAEMMRPGVDKGTLQAALRARLDASQASFDQKLTLVKMAFEHGILEQHQIRRDYPEFFGRLTSALGDLTSGSQTQTRVISSQSSEPAQLDPSTDTDREEANTKTGQVQGRKKV